LKLAVRDRIISRHPCDKLDNIKLEDTERQFLTFEEIKQLSVTIPEKINQPTSSKNVFVFLFHRLIFPEFAVT